MLRMFLAVTVSLVLLATDPGRAARVSAVLHEARAEWRASATAAAALPTPTLAAVVLTVAPTSEVVVIDLAPEPTAEPQAACSLDWTLPYSPETYTELAHCRHLLYLESGSFACPPEGTPWAAYFRDAFCVAVPAFGGTLPPPPPPPATPTPPAAYP
jgi:hypothetical protein